jgi:hypothetical protein
MAKGERTAKRGIGSTILRLINPIRDPSLLVAIILTAIEEGSSGSPEILIGVGLLNWVAVKAVIWLLVNFAFSFVYLARKAGWVIRNPRLAWRLLDALGTEEVIIGGLAPDMFVNEEGALHQGNMGMMATMMAQYGYGGPMSAPYGPDQGYEGEYADYGPDGGYGRGPQPSERLDEQGEQMRAMLYSYSKLIDDWMGFTEEKWRAVSDSQLGWKPLRGRWNGWEEIYSDAFGARDDEYGSAQNDTMERRFRNAQEKGSAASAVTCFLHDLDVLRQSVMSITGQAEEEMPRVGGVDSRPQVSQRTSKRPIIRNPMIVDADG